LGFAYTEELPGAISEGDTLDEARNNLRDAIELLLEANRVLASQSHRGKKVAREKITVPFNVICEGGIDFDPPLGNSQWLRAASRRR